MINTPFNSFPIPSELTHLSLRSGRTEIEPLTAPNLAFHMNFKCEDACLREEAKLESLANRVN